MDDEVFVFAKKGGEWLGDFHKVLYESLVKADVPEKAPQISYGSQERKVSDDLYLGLIHSSLLSKMICSSTTPSHTIKWDFSQLSTSCFLAQTSRILVN